MRAKVATDAGNARLHSNRMLPVFQTRFNGPGGGNCLSACVASLLELPIEQVPDFNASSGYWFRDLVDWCADRDVGVIYMDQGTSLKGIYSKVLCIEVWTVKGIEERHAIVSKRDLVTKEGLKQWQWRRVRVHDPKGKPSALFELQYVLILLPGVEIEAGL